LAGWKNKSYKDANSQSLGGADIYNNEIRFEYNDSSKPKTINLNGSYRDVKKNTIKGQITIEPYSSVILIKNKND
jgi:hypothetical protein